MKLERNCGQETRLPPRTCDLPLHRRAINAHRTLFLTLKNA
jgi:hypothetical protein